MLILAVVVPGIGFLIKFAWDFNRDMSRLEVRIGSIVAALPDLRTRTAFESLFRPMVSAVVVSKPVSTNAGEWKTTARLIDATNGRVATYIRTAETGAAGLPNQ